MPVQVEYAVSLTPMVEKNLRGDGARRGGRTDPNFLQSYDLEFWSYVKNSIFCQKNFWGGVPLSLPPK